MRGLVTVDIACQIRGMSLPHEKEDDSVDYWRRDERTIKIHGAESFEGMRRAGRLAAETLDFITEHVQPGVTTGHLDKLCHDFISPAGAIVSGLDLLDDPSAKDMKDEAMELIAASARKLVDQLAFARVAFGASAGVAGFDCGELERLTRAIYAHVRAELEWATETPQLSKAAAQALVNIAQLAAGALPSSRRSMRA